jgi:thiol-disulfide isomerase/thioredoxin
VAFAVFIAVAAFAYNILSEKVAPKNNIGIAQDKGKVESHNSETAKEKIKAPDFTVLDSKGKSVKLSDMLGKPIVLNFWASWCPPCKSEMPEFNAVYGEMSGDITFMMVDLVDGQRETKEKGESYVAKQGFSFPVYYDTEQEAAYTYGIASIPTTLFIDKDGYIITGVQGAIDKKTLRKWIDSIKQE